MTCEVHVREGTICVSGEMTIYAAAALKENLFAAQAGQPQQCPIDLSQVTELDTTGLQILLMARRSYAARGAKLLAVEPSDAVREVLNLLCIDDLAAAPAAGETR